MAEDAYASLIVAKKPPEGGHNLANASHGTGQDRGKFNASPLPLGGEYVNGQTQAGGYQSRGKGF